MQAPLELSYTSVPMNALKTTLTNKLKYRRRRKENSDLMTVKYKTNLIYHYRIGTKTIPPNLANKWRECWLKKENDEQMEAGRAILL